MQNAYKAGLVFRGDIDLPMIIIEPYLEPELNMHASREAFAARQRLIEARGNANNLAIWMIASDSDARLKHFVLQALNRETRWLNAGSRPDSVMDACYDENNKLIAQGANVFRGQVSEKGGQVLGGYATAANPGACTHDYPIYSDPRIVSGLSVSDHVYKCALQPVNTALTDGTYGNVTFTAQQKDRLRQIYPTGV